MQRKISHVAKTFLPRRLLTSQKLAEIAVVEVHSFRSNVGCAKKPFPCNEDISSETALDKSTEFPKNAMPLRSPRSFQQMTLPFEKSVEFSANGTSPCEVHGVYGTSSSS